VIHLIAIDECRAGTTLQCMAAIEREQLGLEPRELD
jgi:hypothetical protein